ncbi:MAG: hypothetical protein J1G38_04090 [Clostridiales bacterium]|nr:hypothetical protein [Clostridiales bacterium]
MKGKAKRTLLVLAACLACVFGLTAFGLAACEDAELPVGVVTLTAPDVKLVDNVISWKEVKNATYYMVYEGEDVADGEGEIVRATTYTIEKTAPGDYVYTVSAYNTLASPKYGPRSEKVTYTVKSGKPDVPPGGDDDPPVGGDDELSSPLADIEGNALNWQPVLNAASYDIYKNGEKVDSVEGFESLGDTIIPTTYTIKDAKNGDKFAVVAVSGSDDYEDSEPCDELEYTALGTTLSLTTPVYITDATKTVPVAAAGTYKVVVKPNNNLAVSAGVHGTSAIKVSGSLSDNNPPYGADATLEEGVWTATVVVTGDLTLTFGVTTVFKEVTLGYTVSLEQAYESGDEPNVVRTYNLGATDSVDVTIPYTGYRIKVVLGDDVPNSGNILYVVLDDGSTNSTITITIGNNNTLLTAKDGYYVSNSFSYGSGAIYLSCDTVDLKATISLKEPDVVFENAPFLTVDSPVFDYDIGDAKAPSMFKLDDVETGEYLLVLEAFLTDLTFYAKLGDGNYAKLASTANQYHLTLNVTNETILYVYCTETDGMHVDSVSLFETGVAEYDLSAGKTVVDALIGSGAANATVFTLKDVEAGKYTLTVTGASGLTFKAVVGDATYDLDYNNDDAYSKKIEIADQASIKVYLTSGLYVADVTIVKNQVLELTHGLANGTQFTIEPGTEVEFELNGVPDGTYRVALSGFNEGDTYDNWIYMTATVGNNTVDLCGSNNGYLGAQWVEIKGETTLTVFANNFGGKKTWTIYLLDDGEADPGMPEEADSSTYLYVENFMLTKKGEYYDIDISGLAAGEYTLSVDFNYSNTWQDSKMYDPEYEYYLDSDSENTETIIGDSMPQPAVGKLTIPEGGAQKLYIRCNNLGEYTKDGKTSGNAQKVHITIEIVGGGDGPIEGGGSDTSADIQAYAAWISWVEIEVGNLKYGEYTVTLDGAEQDILGNYDYFALGNSSSGADEVGFYLTDGVLTATFTVKQDKVYLYTNGSGGPVTLHFTLNGGGGNVAGGSMDDPIICEDYTGTFTAYDLQDAWFQLPAVGFMNMGSMFTFEFELGVTVKKYESGSENALTSGSAYELDWMNPTFIHVIAPEGMLCSFTVSAGGAGEDEEGTLGTTRSVTVDIPSGTDSVTVFLGATVSEAKTYIIKASGDIGDDVVIWIFSSSWAAEQSGEEDEYAMGKLTSATDFGAQVEGLWFSIAIKASSELTNITITLEEA